jgi:hypothetical protein
MSSVRRSADIVRLKGTQCIGHQLIHRLQVIVQHVRHLILPQEITRQNQTLVRGPEVSDRLPAHCFIDVEEHPLPIRKSGFRDHLIPPVLPRPRSEGTDFS